MVIPTPPDDAKLWSVANVACLGVLEKRTNEHDGLPGAEQRFLGLGAEHLAGGLVVLVDEDDELRAERVGSACAMRVGRAPCPLLHECDHDASSTPMDSPLVPDTPEQGRSSLRRGDASPKAQGRGPLSPVAEG